MPSLNIPLPKLHTTRAFGIGSFLIPKTVAEKVASAPTVAVCGPDIFTKSEGTGSLGTADAEGGADATVAEEVAVSSFVSSDGVGVLFVPIVMFCVVVHPCDHSETDQLGHVLSEGLSADFKV